MSSRTRSGSLPNRRHRLRPASAAPTAERLTFPLDTSWLPAPLGIPPLEPKRPPELMSTPPASEEDWDWKRSRLAHLLAERALHLTHSRRLAVDYRTMDKKDPRRTALAQEFTAVCAAFSRLNDEIVLLGPITRPAKRLCSGD